MQARYEKNIYALAEPESESLSGKKICVVGCGGLGGYVVEMMARIGVGYITVVDYDVFSESNLNRQLFSSERNLGELKVEAARERIGNINSTIVINAVTQPFDEKNAACILDGHDVAVDALDNVPSRFILQKYCGIKNIPLVHGSIGGWYGQVTTILPGDDSFSLLYGGTDAKGVETTLGNLGFTAAATASVQCSEIVKLLVGRGEIMSKKLLRLDLLANEFITVNIS